MRTIGKLAKESGVGVETVRFYERQGLIQQPKKRSGFRTYAEDDARKIRFVKRAQDLGFTLKEVKALLELNRGRRVTRKEISDRADAKIKEIEGKIADLERMKASLREIKNACGQSPEALACCRIIDCFESYGECKPEENMK